VLCILYYQGFDIVGMNFSVLFLGQQFCACVWFSTGILDEVLNRLRFDSPIGATILQSDGDRKPATHFVSEDMKVLSDNTVKKGKLSHFYIPRL